eukprot:7930655-Pyramimonas_sp.AAC.2
MRALITHHLRQVLPAENAWNGSFVRASYTFCKPLTCMRSTFAWLCWLTTSPPCGSCERLTDTSPAGPLLRRPVIRSITSCSFVDGLSLLAICAGARGNADALFALREGVAITLGITTTPPGVTTGFPGCAVG